MRSHDCRPSRLSGLRYDASGRCTEVWACPGCERLWDAPALDDGSSYRLRSLARKMAVSFARDFINGLSSAIKALFGYPSW